ncbi:hypothetical protein [Embleya sp. NBC_00896]|uniref:hypothetical protein n=1 Tax=Embleya sp. NBC_00896 TaxID=2975961 RepID=UPI003863D386|nr:hypothetical protein OG928_32320 [Embleya sp. NBC_00896]
MWAGLRCLGPERIGYRSRHRSAATLAPDLTLVQESGTRTAMDRAAYRVGDAVREDWDVLELQRRVHNPVQAPAVTVR